MAITRARLISVKSAVDNEVEGILRNRELELLSETATDSNIISADGQHDHMSDTASIFIATDNVATRSHRVMLGDTVKASGGAFQSMFTILAEDDQDSCEYVSHILDWFRAILGLAGNKGIVTLEDFKKAARDYNVSAKSVHACNLCSHEYRVLMRTCSSCLTQIIAKLSACKS